MIIFTILLLIPTGLALEVEPQNYELELVAGENVTIDFSVSSDSDLYEVGTITTTINGQESIEGINISYKDSPMVLPPDTEVDNELYVVTATNLKPDNYTFETDIKIEKEVVKKRSTDYEVIYRNVTQNETDNETEKIIVENKTHIGIMKQTINDLQNEIEAKNDMIDIIIDNYEQTLKDTIRHGLYAIILNMILLVILGYMLITNKMKNEEEKGDD